MPERSICKITKNGNSLTLALPRPLLHKLGWQLGNRVLLEARDGCLVVAELEDAMVNRALDRIPELRPATAHGYGR